MTCQSVLSGSGLEPQIGFPRAVGIGNTLAVGGAGPIAPQGVIRPRNIRPDICPVTTVMQVSAFVDCNWLVEIDPDALLPDALLKDSHT